MFRGVYTAIITPFDRFENVDEKALRNLVDFNIQEGVSGIVPCGTTGESSTLSHPEHDRVIQLVTDHVNGRVPVIAGTGSNSTQEAILLSQHAEQAGVDGLLLVSPYYNKPTQEGLYQHFRSIADSVDIPCIVYNIPGRTGVNIETETLLRMIDACDNIVAVKEASGDMAQIREVIRRSPADFSVLSGDDNIAVDVIRAGGQGVVSVASNLLPGPMTELVRHALDGNFLEAESIQNHLSPVFEAEFIETNPIPIKYMLSLEGWCEEVYRLPMCELMPSNKIRVRELMRSMELVTEGV